MTQHIWTALQASGSVTASAKVVTTWNELNGTIALHQLIPPFGPIYSGSGVIFSSNDTGTGSITDTWLSASNSVIETVEHVFIAMSASTTCGVPFAKSACNNDYFLFGNSGFWYTTVASGSTIVMAARVPTVDLPGWKSKGVNVIHIKYGLTTPLISCNSGSCVTMSVYVGTSQYQSVHSHLYIGRRSNPVFDEASFNGQLFDIRYYLSGSITDAQTGSIISNIENAWSLIS